MNRNEPRKSKRRLIALLLVALMLSALIPLASACVCSRDPLAVAADLSPDLPVTTDDLVCSFEVSGSNADEATVTYAWYKNDVLQSQLTENTVDAGRTAKGETWRCVATASHGTDSADGYDQVTVQNCPPTAPVADVTPDLPHAADNLTCSLKVPSSDADGDEVTYAYAWYKDAVMQPQLTGNTVDASNNARGQTWRCLVTASDGAGGNAGSFDEVTIDSGNSAPSVPTIDISPRQPTTTDDLECSIVLRSSDPDRDPVTYAYTWYKDGVLQPQMTGDTVDAIYTTRWETWRCVVTASDGMGGNSGQFSEVTIQNSPPTAPAVDVTPDRPALADNLTCSIEVESSDADGDTMTYAYAWYKDAVLQPDLTEKTVDASYPAQQVTWRCVVTASDGEGGSASGYDEVDTPPAARDPGPVNSLLTYGTGWRYVTNATDRNHIIEAMTDFGCNTLELQIDPTVFAKIAEEPVNMVAGIQAFNAAGIQVWACWNNSGGVVSWDGLVGGHTIHEFTDLVLKWNKDHPTASFTALGFDLEPVTGSTLEQHKTHLEGVYATLQTMRAHVVDGTETIDSQELPVVMFCDPRWGNSVCVDAWAQVVSQLDVVELDYYRWGGGGYPEGIDYSIAYNTNALAVVINMGRYFMCALSCDELPKTVDASDPYLSRFNLGRTAYEQAMQDYATYYNDLYPDNFVGYTSYFDVAGFVYWFNIDSVTSWPSGTFASGDTMTINYQTRRRTDRYTHRIFGIQMELKDSAGTVSKGNKVIDVIDGQTTSRAISLTVPEEVADGAASIRLTMWAVGYYNEGRYDLLYYEDYSGHQSELLAMTMDELAARTTGPNGALTGKRSTFFVLQDTGWQSGITLNG